MAVAGGRPRRLGGIHPLAPPAARRLLSGASAPSEMSLETNVLRYLANCIEWRGGLEEGSVAMASPTQNEEAHMGYDSQVGLPDGRYVLLQFKRPRPRRSHVSFKVPSGQVSALLGYPEHSSFFALPAVRTNDEMWRSGAALLDRTLVVDACDLCASFDASMPAGLDWFDGSKPAVRTVRIMGAATGHAASISQGREQKNFETIPSLPISCLCDSGRYGFVVRDGAVLARDGTAPDRKKYPDAAE